MSFLSAGTYQVVFANAFFSSCGCAKANLTVNIVRCPKGHVTGGRDDTCNRCPKGLFSFNSQDVQCSICGANTVCPGGATVWAAPGLWHSAPQSIQMHRWVKVVVVVWMHVGSFDGWKRCVCVPSLPHWGPSLRVTRPSWGNGGCTFWCVGVGSVVRVDT